MISYSYLDKERFGRVCRQCLNEEFHLRLCREDCSYLYFMYQCRSCKKCKNIVTGIRLISRWKLLSGKEVKV